MRLRRRLRDERGMALPVVLGVLLVGSLLAAGAFAVAAGDITPSRNDQDSKQAYAAAEGGLDYYIYHLSQNANYWMPCDAVPAPDPARPSEQPVNQVWSSGADTRRWRPLPGGQSRYTIELLPARGYSACEPNIVNSVVDPSTGILRIRATGQSRGERRSLIASLRRTKFLDFLYFTDLETLDPATYPDAATVTWAGQHCLAYWPQRDNACTLIQFGANDVIAGPMHTNDEIQTCGATTLGRTASDAIEVSGPAPGYQRVCGSTRPNMQGSYVNPAPPLTMPQTNASLRTTAEPAYRFSGTTTIELHDTDMTVTSPAGGAPRTLPYPSNGVVYVESSSCGIAGYSRAQRYTNPIGCGDLWISGSTATSLTFATDNDVIITADLLTTNGAQIGLIANNFVRVYHPVLWDDQGACTGNASTTPTNITIQAAILSLAHSFLVDNWHCGGSLGTLTVRGAIAQRFRGPVGTTSGTGYIKNYVYDDRFRYSSPPYFLDPVQAGWKVTRQNEQVPAR
jgi:hypothetical protein